MRTQNKVAGEPDEQVLAARIDTFDRATTHGRCLIYACQAWEYRFKPSDRAARQRVVQPACRTENSVAFRHASLFVCRVVPIDVGEGAVRIEILVVYIAEVFARDVAPLDGVLASAHGLVIAAVVG